MKKTRYAVVLNGGVSLAIWMGGVTEELNRMRLASEALLDPTTGRESSNAWTAILETCQRRAVVDVVAGTSAGGLNGTLLATAVARGADMPNMRDLWSTVASLAVGHLTRKDKDIASATSVLDGDYFSNQVRVVVGSIVPQSGLVARDCTLLVTATALDSDPIPTALEIGTMYTRDGRRVYRFDRTTAPPGQPTEAGVDDFAIGAATVAALERAARASASFPVAFAPVRETLPLAGHRVNAHEDTVGRWLVDGGVLDNAPFEPILEVLREKPTDEPFERVLLYVTPGVSGEDLRPPAAMVPSLRSTMGSVISAMREPDERLDADALHDLYGQISETKSQAFQTIADYLQAPQQASLNGLLGAASDLLTAYRTTRAEATERWLISRSTTREQPLTAAPPTLLTPDQIPGIPAGSFPAYDAAAWTWGWSAADRILRWWGRALSTVAPDNPAVAQAMDAVGTAQRTVSAQDKILTGAVSGSPSNPVCLEQQMAAMIDVYAGGLTDVLTDVMGPTAIAIADAIPGANPTTLMTVSLAIEVISGIFSWAGDDYDAPIIRFQRVTPAAEIPPGIDLGEAGANADWPAKKLYGERLGHFGAFVSGEGRLHDWLWGRLDGASELSKSLLDDADVPEYKVQELMTALIDEILAAEDTDADKIQADAAKVYQTQSNVLLQQMADFDDGASFRHLEATLWQLSRQFGVTGSWLRALLAPSWRPEGEELPLKLRVLMRGARCLTALPRRHLRHKLPYR